MYLFSSYTKIIQQVLYLQICYEITREEKLESNNEDIVVESLASLSRWLSVIFCFLTVFLFIELYFLGTVVVVAAVAAVAGIVDAATDAD